MEHMKWWGWGEEGISFTHEDKPDLAPFVRERIGVDLDAPPQPPPSLDDLVVPPPRIDDDLRARLEAAVGANWVVDDLESRVVHAYGKSLRDLLRLRSGDAGRPPDLVVYPGSEHEVSLVVAACLGADAVVIPFGGGTNISGSVEPPRGEQRTVVSVDLGRMDRVLEVDEASRLARVEAGVLGPNLEDQLKALGWTLGHFPDSFRHSSLGGWIATRSSGMQSDRYGDIAEITRGMRVVTPLGTLSLRPLPATSTGPSVREMVLGSEGRLGIITEATVQVHRSPDHRATLGYLFPGWHAALEAMRAVAASSAAPVMTRVSDPAETQFSFATRKRPSLLDRLKSRGLQGYLVRRRGWAMDQACLGFVGYEGTKEDVAKQRKLVGTVLAAHGAICIGSGPGELYDQKKFDTPYIRDHLLDRGGIADVSETAAPWSLLGAMHSSVVEAAEAAFRELGVRGWIMCHLSHSYHSGACLYFTFAFQPHGSTGAMRQYDTVKGAVQQAFVDNGGTLSHHHAVGTEHARWLAEDLSEVGASMVKVLLDGVDPGANMNPGKIT